MRRSRKKSRCIRCGKEEGYKDFLCKSCYMEKDSLLGDFKEVNLTICPLCSRYRKGKIWKKYPKGIYTLLREKVRESLGNGADIKIVDDRKVYLRKGDEEYLIPISLDKKECPDCSRKRGGYYEAVLQLRGMSQKRSEKVVDFLKEDISRIEHLKEGIDIYLRSRRKIGRTKELLLRDGPLIVKKSRKLHTLEKDTGRKIYRFTVLFKKLDLKTGERIIFKGKEYEVLVVEKGSVVVKGADNKRRKILISELERYGSV